MNLIQKYALAATTAVLLSSAAQAAIVQTGLVNGNFAINAGAGQVGANTTLGSWTAGGKEGNFGGQTTAPVFLYSSAASLATGVTGDSFMGSVGFYGGNKLTSLAPSGAIIAADGDRSWAGSISQIVNGLVVGTEYTLSFNWAGAQQLGFSGPTTEKWNVTFGSVTQSTSTVSTLSQNFTGWQTANLKFTATSSTQTLKFLAAGTPAGSPPWLLLNNVQLNAPAAAVPEPSTWVFALCGLMVFGLKARRSASRSKA